MRHYDEQIKDYIKHNKIIANNNKSMIVNIFNIVNDIEQYPQCVMCSKEVKRFKSFIDGWYDTCCVECATMKKYGVKHIMKNPEFIKKFKKTIEEKFGGIGFGAKQIAEKSRKTMTVKYGNDYQKQFAIKAKITNIERYGAEHIMQTTAGVSHYLRGRVYDEEFSDKMRRYLTKAKSKKMSNGQLKSKYNRLKKQLEGKFQLLFGIDQYVGMRDNGINKKYQFKCLQCNRIFQSAIVNVNRDNGLICPGCKVGYRSYIQHIIIEDLRKKYLTLTFQEDKIGLFDNRKEVDIYCVQKNLAIQYNGNSWHSQKNNNYTQFKHFQKFKLCYDKGIKFIAFWSDEFNKKYDRIQLMLNDILDDQCNVIYGKQLNLVDFDEQIYVPDICYLYLKDNVLVDFYCIKNISKNEFLNILHEFKICKYKLESRLIGYYTKYLDLSNNFQNPQYYMFIKNKRSIQTYNVENNSDKIWNYGYVVGGI